MIINGTPAAEGIAGHADIEVAFAVAATAGRAVAGLIYKAGFCSAGLETIRQMIFNAAQEQVGQILSLRMHIGGGDLVDAGI